MGVDVNLYVDGTVTDEEYERGVEEFAFRITDATLTRDGWTSGRVELDRESSWTCYWGPGYERGPWPQIAGWIEALRAAFPNHTICYGGDTTGEAIPVDDELMTEYWAHWRSPHAHDYRDAFRTVGDAAANREGRTP